MGRIKVFRLATLILTFVTFGMVAGSQNAKSNGTKPAPQARSVRRPADPSLYVGSDVCAGCHDSQSHSFNRGPHWKTELANKRGPEWQGCESCHGPGKAHAESADPAKIIRFNQLTSANASQQCLDCHEYGAEHSNFSRSQHLQNNVGCTDCHSVHQPKIEARLLKASQPSLCYGCHQETKADFVKPTHHRVNEGLMSCSNCHNPHGGFLTRQLRATAEQDQVCFGCHREKAGPFVFEHAPVKTEGCVSCHTPHGSGNAHMLRRSQVNTLCLECHTLTVDSAAPAIPTFHNQAQKYQACTLCHVAVHGSNTDATFFKF